MRVNTQAIRTAILERLPQTFDEQWLRSTWSGAHGRLGLHAEPVNVSTAVTVREQSLEALSTVSGTVNDIRGNVVGRFTRDANLHPNGRLGVYHALLELDPNVQRTGFGSSFNRASFDAYAKAGVDDVTIDAGLDAGGYVWARTGFELAPTGARGGAAGELVAHARMLRDFVFKAARIGAITRQEYDQLAPRLIGTDNVVRPDTLVSIRELAAIDGVGERILKRTEWEGIREIPKVAPWWSQVPRGIPAAVAQAEAGAAHLRSIHMEPYAMRATRETVTRLLPGALEPGTLTKAVERASSGNLVRLAGTGDAHTAVNLISGAIEARASFSVFDRGTRIGRTSILVTPDSTGQLVARRTAPVPGQFDSSRIGTAIDDALRGAIS